MSTAFAVPFSQAKNNSFPDVPHSNSAKKVITLNYHTLKGVRIALILITSFNM